MEVLTVVYGAFRDRETYRDYYDLVFTEQSLIILWLGSVPLTHIKRSPLPRTVEMHLLRVSKSRMRSTDIETLRSILKQSKRLREIPYTDIALITLRETEIPLPPILRKPPSDPRQRPRYTQQVLEISIYLGRNNIEKFYTSTKLKKELKKILKELMLTVPGIEV